jgi:hypothetical protein
MYNSIFADDSGTPRLFELLVQFQQGNPNSFERIVKRFNFMLYKASYNSYTGTVDDDLRSEILLSMFQKLHRFVIPDRETIISKLVAREDELLAM